MIERTSLIDPLFVIIVPLLWLNVDALSLNDKSKFFNAVAAKIEYFSAKFDGYAVAVAAESLSVSC